jgi:RNA polymerase sigma-70 factor (ECF subfamily)
MTSGAAPRAIAVTQAIEAVMRNDRGRLLAALIARLGDFQLAEEALQEAALSAMSHWGRSGLPASPQGWLLKVALRKAIDRLRGGAREARKAADLARLALDEAADTEPEMIPDERLRLIFTCCHPALERKSQVALTLRAIAGLSTAQIARAFLDAEPTMGQRLSRAKARIASAGIPFAVPGPEDWAARLQAVLAVIYLIFTAGHGQDPADGQPLCEEAIFLARLLDRLRPGEAESEGALALLLVTHARRGARVGADGATVPPAEQDRARWDRAMIAEGVALIDRAMARRAPGPYQIKAAIAALHCAEAPTDWRQIVLLYDALLRMEPTPVVGLNRAVALAEAGAPEAGLRALDRLSAVLGSYQPYHAARADLLHRLGRRDESLAAYDRAIAGAQSSADAAFLTRRRARAAL